MAKLEPIKATMPPNSTWKELVKRAFSQNVDLSGRHWNYPFKKQDVITYFSYGAACSEAELDVLTGEYQINRVDILYDSGKG